MNYIGKWVFNSIGTQDDEKGMIYLNGDEYLASPMPYIDETDEEAVADEINERKKTIGMQVKICDDGKLYFLMPIPDGVSKAELKEVIDSGEFMFIDDSLVDPLVYITPFSSVTANVSSNDVVITGNFGAWGPTMQTAGFYIGTSKTNMTKVTETLNTNGYVNGVAIQNIFYSMSKWYPYLKQGNTYYYKMYITRNGKEYCSDIYSFSYGTHTHSWDSGITTQWPTCTQSGTRVYSCTGCNATKTETISAKGHQYGSWTTVKEATIAQDGESRTYCSNCDAYKTKRIPRLSENLSSDFDDVKSDSWYKPYIDYAYTYGLLKGTGVRQMQPERTVTRAEFVQILASLAGVNTSNKNVFSGFADVKPGQWYTPAVKWASENGIVSGISATKFAPNNKITREQMCTMLVKFIENYMHITIKNKNQKTTFTDDAFISSWAKYSVYKCQTGGLVSGVSASLFAPKNYATRASAAVIISQFHAEYAK